MSAAYYDIQAEQGATFRISLSVADESGNSLNLIGDSNGFIPISQLPTDFQDRFIITNDEDEEESIAKAYIRMQVRNTVDGVVLPITPPLDATSTYDDLALFGVSGFGVDYFPIDIQLGDGGSAHDEPNVIITIDAIHMEGILYGKPLYDIELVYAQDRIDHPKKVVYRILQGRFIITPNVTK